MTNTRIIKATGISAMILAVLAFGCKDNSQLHAVNRTNEIVRTLTITLPGSRLETKDLGAGHSWTWRYRPERDSCFQVRAALASGAVIEASCVGYTTPNEKIEHRIILSRDGSVAYEVVD